MEMTKISTLSVPEVKMNVDPADAIRFCDCRYRRGQNRLAEPSVDFILSGDSPTTSGMCYCIGEARLPERLSVDETCQVSRFMQRDEEGGTADGTKVLPSLGSVTVDLSRFFKQAAISVGLVSTGRFCSVNSPPTFFRMAVWLGGCVLSRTTTHQGRFLRSRN